MASPQEDLRAFQGYFQQRFPDVPLNSFVNGAYAIDAKLRAQWHALMQFPPYSFALDRGKQLFHTAFDNGSSYAGCLANGGVGIKQNYPYFDTKTDKVVTLALAINRCRTENGEQPLPYKTGDMAAILAYMAYTSRGNAIDIKIPQDPAALAAYRAGKEFYYSRHGQLNFSCASCHVQNAGKRLRAETLSPALGPPASFPVYRSKWGGMGTLHRRFSGCLRLIRAEPFPPQSQTYRNLEYFLMYMSNGLPVAGPASRP
ncbi:MAG: sulfur oxidation c-type cytochrome SoxA [Salinisphaera sp.]|nr:sulfur oxidation c-type cytochrome SoxA [Salinisphaera sp.]